MRRPLVLALTVAAFAAPAAAIARPPVATPPGAAEAIMSEVRTVMRDDHLRAAIVGVTRGGRPIVTRALGQSQPGVPATTRMRFRIGAVSIPYVTTVLLQLQDEGRLSLDDPVATWLPDLPNADRVTLRMLANWTSGYPDYVTDPGFLRVLDARPYRRWTEAQVLRVAFSNPVLFPPGTDFRYSHTNVVLLGQVISRVTGQPLAAVIRERILRPLRLSHTASNDGPAMRGPVLHAWATSRGRYQDSTWWNPSWSLAHGAIMTSDIRDAATTARAIGSGSLISADARAQMVAPTTQHMWKLSPRLFYGLGVRVAGGWIVQNPSFNGYSGVTAYLPTRDIAIAAVTTTGPDGDPNAESAVSIARRISARLAPGNAMPVRP